MQKKWLNWITSGRKIGVKLCNLKNPYLNLDVLILAEIRENYHFIILKDKFYYSLMLGVLQLKLG